MFGFRSHVSESKIRRENPAGAFCLHKKSKGVESGSFFLSHVFIHEVPLKGPMVVLGEERRLGGPNPCTILLCGLRPLEALKKPYDSFVHCIINKKLLD